MALPEKNVWFEQLPPHAHIELKQCGTNSVYIYVDDDGVAAVVGMDGRKQASQQRQLERLAEETISKKLYKLGYRYRMTPTDKSFDPLHVKTAQDAARVMREDFPTKRFTIHEINERGETLHRLAKELV